MPENIYDLAKRAARSKIAERELEDLLSTPIPEMGISTRTCNTLEERGIMQLKDLLGRTQEDLVRIPNLGEKTLNHVLAALWDHGVCKKDSQRPKDDSKPEPQPVGQSRNDGLSRSKAYVPSEP